MSGDVLLVDDSLTVRMDLRDGFEGAGLRVVTCSSVGEARRALAEKPFGVIVLDVLLPDGDGIALLEEIRRSKLNARARVMLLSTEAEVRDRIRGITRGADEYVGKPYDLGYVVARAKELLGPEERPRNGRRSVLVIDDDQGFRERLAETLERAGYRALGASTGEEGLHVAAEARPDAVIVDAVLPGIDGATVVRRMKLDAGLRHTPALMLTGWNRTKDEVDALESGADAFARKESGADAVLARLAVILRGIERPAETLPPSALGPKKILAVDDSPTYLHEISSHLRREGYEVITAVSGEEALDLLRVQAVDCVLLDILMPGVSGHDTARQIRSSAEWRNLPIILLTSLDESRALIEGINSGADDFVNKSSPFEVVGARVRAHLRRRQVEEENRLGREQSLRQEAANRLLTAVQEEKERIRRRNAVLAGIAQIFQDTLSTRTEEELGSTCLAIAEDVTRSQCAFLGEINRQTGRMDDVSISDLGWEACRMSDRAGHDRKLPVGLEVHGLYGRVLEDGKGFFTNDPSSHPDRIGTPPGHLPLKSFLGVPLLRDGRTVGMVGLGNREGGYGPEELEIAEALAPAIVQAFVSKRADRALREREERLAVTLRSIGDAVIATDVAGRMTVFNRVAEELTGWKAEEAVGRALHEVFEIIDEDTRQPAENPVRRVLEEGGVVGLGNHTVLLARDGTERPIADSAAPIRDASGGITGVVLVFRDQTRERRAEQALRQADRRKDEFLGMLSHELRNPLAPITNSLYVLEQAPPGSERARQAQGIIRRQTEHLTRLVDDLLDVTRIARGKIELHPARVDLREVVRGACHDHQVLFQDRGLALRVATAESLWIDADETRIAQVIGNLLQNAVRFSRPDGTVTVSVGTADGQAQIRVGDDGIGIPPEFLTLVFEPFVQADRELARTKGGLGLGLALVKGLVELHGGAVSAHSEGLGRGSEFLVKLPLAMGPAQPAPPPRPTAETRRLSVLVIEDNLDEATSLRAALEVAGHRVEIARDGPEGIEAARSLAPDVVLCDIGLPGMDGYEVARAMRGDPALAAIRLIAVTGYARPEDVRAAQEAGFDHHVPKPASMAELERAMSGRLADREVAGGDSAPERTPAPVRAEPVKVAQEGARGRAEVAPAADLGALVSRASHDLRAPLRHIEAFSEALLERRGAELGEVGREQVSKIQRARRRAQAIVDDLLTLWQVSSADLAMTAVDLTALAHQVLADLRRAEPARIVDVHLEEGVTASGDAQLLQVLLQNLLGNAWKYTSKQPSARIEFGRAATPTGTEYFVRDDGEGFDMARAGKIFEPFQRLHSTDEFEGTGLGLHVARRVVERHAGRAWIESAPGRGTTVRFTLGARPRARGP